MTTASFTVLMVIAPVDFRDEELLVPRAAFLKQGWMVDTVSTRTGTATGMLGATELITKTLENVLETMTPSEYQAIVIVGGMGSVEYLWHNETLHTLLKTLDSQGAVLSAICLSSAVLALAGLAKGKQLSVYRTPESVSAITGNGGTYTSNELTTDGRMITANGPEAAESFADAIITALQPALIA